MSHRFFIYSVGQEGCRMNHAVGFTSKVKKKELFHNNKESR